MNTTPHIKAGVVDIVIIAPYLSKLLLIKAKLKVIN